MRSILNRMSSAGKTHPVQVVPIVCLLYCAALFPGSPRTLFAAEVLPNPRLQSIFPPGAQQGTTVEVSVSGLDLDDLTSLLFSHPGIVATQKTLPAKSFESGPQPINLQFTVNVGADVPPGIYEARLLGRFGISSPRHFAVGDLPETRATGKNISLSSAEPLVIDSLVNGQFPSADSIHYYKFTARQGERLLIRCASHQLDSRMLTMLEVLNSDGNPVAFGRATSLQPPRIDLTSPADGEYVLKVYDATFQGGVDCFYRLEISTRPFVDFVWPPVGQPGSTNQYKLYGSHLPGGVPGKDFDAKWNLEELTVPITLPQQPTSLSLTTASTIRALAENEAQGFEYRFQGGKLASHPVFIAAAQAPVVLEQEPNQSSDQPQMLTLPCEVAGRFFPDQDPDWFSFAGKAGVNYSIEVSSERMNAPTDSAVTVFRAVKDAAGKETLQKILERDDLPNPFANAPFDVVSHDPSLQFIAPADGLYQVQIRNLYAGANSQPQHLYHMLIRPARGDFQLVATAKELGESASQQDPQRATALNLRRGGTQPVLVQAYRREGFDGPISLTVEGLPPGVTCPSITMAAGESQATLVFGASLEAASWHGLMHIFGAAEIHGQPVRHEALAATITWDKNNTAEIATARIMSNLALAVIPEAIPLSVSLAEERVWDTARGGKLEIPAKFTRQRETQGNLKLEIRGLPTSLYPLNRIPVKVLDPQVNEGAVEFVANPKLRAGDYPCYLAVQTRTKYARNPEAADSATARLTKLEAEIAELEKSVKSATESQAAAEKQLSMLDTTNPEQKSPIKQATAARDQAVGMKTEAAARLKAAQAELPNAKKQLENLKKAAAPKEIELFVASLPFVIRIRELPINLTFTPPEPLTPGATATLPFQLERLYGFQSDVTLSAKIPAAAAGLQLKEFKVPASATAGQLAITTTAQTPPGEYPLQIHAKLNFNGQNLEGEFPLTVRIDTKSAAPAVENKK